MARLLIYDAYENKVYTYNSLSENDPMPYSTGRTLTLREFRGKSNSPVLWTTIAAMEAWNLTRRTYGRGIPVGIQHQQGGGVGRPALPSGGAGKQLFAVGVAAGDEVFQIGAQLFRHGLIACAGEVGPAGVGVAARQHREGDALERAQQRDLCFAGGRAVLDLPQVERRVAPGRNHLRTATGAEDPAEG